MGALDGETLMYGNCDKGPSRVSCDMCFGGCSSDGSQISFIKLGLLFDGLHSIFVINGNNDNSINTCEVAECIFILALYWVN